MGNRTHSLLSASLLVLAACDDTGADEATPPPPPCAVLDDGSAITDVDDDRFVVYVISDNAGGLTCVPGVDDVDGETCTDIFLGCTASVESPLNTSTTFTIGIENRSAGGDDILVTGLQFADGTDPSWSIPSVANGNITPGTSLEITLAFRPTVAGEVEGAVSLFSVASNVTGTPSVIQLRGTGTAP